MDHLIDKLIDMGMVADAACWQLSRPWEHGIPAMYGCGWNEDSDGNGESGNYCRYQQPDYGVFYAGRNVGCGYFACRDGDGWTTTAWLIGHVD